MFQKLVFSAEDGTTGLAPALAELKFWRRCLDGDPEQVIVIKAQYSDSGEVQRGIEA